LNSFKGLSKLRNIGKDFKINRCYALTSMEDLKNLEKIGGCFNLDRLDKLTTLNGLEKLTGITEGLTINACRRLNNVAALSNLNTVKKITITYCPYLNDFSSLKSVLQRTGCDLYTEYNGANPTKEELLNKSNEGTNN